MKVSPFYRVFFSDNTQADISNKQEDMKQILGSFDSTQSTVVININFITRTCFFLVLRRGDWTR